MDKLDAKKYDIIIAGGGMVGASMAIASARDGFKVALVEAVQPDNDQQKSFDERTVALTYSSYKIYQSLGIWSDISRQACAINSIEVTDDKHWGYTHLDHLDAQTDTLGYVVATKAVGRVLYQHLEKMSNVDIYCPCSVEQVNVLKTHVCVTLDDSSSHNEIKASCLVVADGGRSNLLNALGVKQKLSPYAQKAMVSIVSSAKSHQNKAYEHFMDDGPLALLPFRENDYALVWTCDEKELNRLLSLNEAQFLSQLNNVFKNRIPTLEKLGQRFVYPLSKSVVDPVVQHRVVVIGNAAHIVHPVAGQGFNLGLRDVAVLADIFYKHKFVDFGDKLVLEKYHGLRKYDTDMVGFFTDGLIKTFSHQNPMLAAMRNLGLTMINAMPSSKRTLLHRTMGIHKQTTRLLNNLK